MNENTNETPQASKNSIADKIKRIVKSFNITERIIFSVVTVIFILTGLAILSQINKTFTIQKPVYGGTYTEGVVGYARYINPILSYTDADKDLTSLVYSGLLKASSDGSFSTDIAESYDVSSDGLTYDFKLKKNLTFHDGSPLTTDDVEFTIQRAQDSTINSSKALNWNGVEIQKISPTEIKFILNKPYAPFIENLTFGILPKHIWSSIQPENFDISAFNREPIGSGPYKIKASSRDKAGLYQSYSLEAFNNYAGGRPLIKNIVIKFYKSEDDAINAFNSGYIDGLGGITPTAAIKAKLNIDNNHAIKLTLPRLFAIFFNQNQSPVLLNKEVRKALNVSVNRDALINDVFNGFATPATGPIPPLSQLSKGESIDTNSIEDAKKILTDAGWKMNNEGVMIKETKKGKTKSTQTLTFSLSTSNIPELKETAYNLKETWSKIGARVEVELYDPADLSQQIIRPRKYNSLLFGNIINKDLDLYPFWHSSQRNDPGLNIALYANIKVDKQLDIARSSTNDEQRLTAFKNIESEITNDIPAIFLYSPDYIYLTSGRAKNIKIENLNHPSERFANINEWYIETEDIWKFLIKQ